MSQTLSLTDDAQYRFNGVNNAISTLLLWTRLATPGSVVLKSSLRLQILWSSVIQSNAISLQSLSIISLTDFLISWPHIRSHHFPPSRAICQFRGRESVHEGIYSSKNLYTRTEGKIWWGGQSYWIRCIQILYSFLRNSLTAFSTHQSLSKNENISSRMRSCRIDTYTDSLIHHN